MGKMHRDINCKETSNSDYTKDKLMVPFGRRVIGGCDRNGAHRKTSGLADRVLVVDSVVTERMFAS